VEWIQDDNEFKQAVRDISKQLAALKPPGEPLPFDPEKVLGITVSFEKDGLMQRIYYSANKDFLVT
jgi:hypothetical protein